MADPVMSILVAIVVLVGTWNLLRDAVNLAMAAVPKILTQWRLKARECLPNRLLLATTCIFGH